jgi:hypothetical protein
MLDDISLGGVYLPRLLIFALIALLLTALSSRLLINVGFYRLVAYPPLVNLALFSIWLGSSVLFMHGN